MSVLERKELEQSPLADLHAIASELRLEGYRRLRREELIEAILGAGGARAGDERSAGAAATQEADEGEGRPRRRARRSRAARRPSGEADEDAAPRARRRSAEDEAAPAGADEEAAEGDQAAPEAEPSEQLEEFSGVLDILPNGSGFMRVDGFAQSRDDVYVSPAQIRRCELRPGDELAGPVRRPRRSERHPSLVRVDTVDGRPAEPPAERPRFEELTPAFATERLAAPDQLGGVPFGKGSRVAIGAAPGSGATTLLRLMVAALRERHPEVELRVVLAGVRPEEVAEWRAADIAPVVGGGFDHSLDAQAHAAEMAVERAKRAVESGRHAALAVDSLDLLPAGAARRVFASARRTEEAGSLTVIAVTAQAPELWRVATTRIALDQSAAPASRPLVSEPYSGALRAELLG